MKRMIAIAPRWPSKNVLIVALALAVVSGLITRPHVQRYYTERLCTGCGAFAALGRKRPEWEDGDTFATAQLCDKQRLDDNRRRLETDPERKATCVVRYHFEWGY
jgi:hypothetical protein